MISRWMTVLLLLFASPALAADGDRYTAGDVKYGDYNRRCSYLCDSATSSDSTCTEFDLANNLGLARGYTFEIIANTSCSSTYDVDVNTGSVSGGLEKDLTALSSTTLSVSVDGNKDRLGRFLMIDLSAMTACTDLTVILCGDYEKP